MSYADVFARFRLMVGTFHGRAHNLPTYQRDREPGMRICFFNLPMTLPGNPTHVSEFF